jgi:hypothetical protein
MSNIVELGRRHFSGGFSDEAIAACEDRLLRAHCEALAEICATLDRHVDVHRRMLNLMLASERKSAALGRLHRVALASRSIRRGLVAPAPRALQTTNP